MLAFLESLYAVPLLGPLLNLLRSRKFITAVVALLVNMLVAQVPFLAEVQTELITVITVLAVAIIGGIAYEDVGKANKPVG